MKKKHQYFAALAFAWVFVILFFGRIIPTEFGIGRSSEKMNVYVVAFGVLFVAALVRITYSMIKHRKEDGYFDRLPPE